MFFVFYFCNCTKYGVKHKTLLLLFILWLQVIYILFLTLLLVLLVLTIPIIIFSGIVGCVVLMTFLMMVLFTFFLISSTFIRICHQEVHKTSYIL